MTALRAEILSTLEQVPDNQLDNVLDFIKKILGGNREIKTPEMVAYEEMHEILRRNKVHVPKDFDYKEEIAKAVLEKYESIS